MMRSRRLVLLLLLTLGAWGGPALAIPPNGFLGIVTALPNGAAAGGVPITVVPLSPGGTGPIDTQTNAYGHLWLSLAPGRYRVYAEGNLNRAPEGEIVSNGEVILWITVVPAES